MEGKSETPEDGLQMTVQEAGRRGGCKTLERRGIQFLRNIGRKDGQRTAELYGELLKEYGRKGGRPRRPTLNDYVEEQDR